MTWCRLGILVLGYLGILNPKPCMVESRGMWRQLLDIALHPLVQHLEVHRHSSKEHIEAGGFGHDFVKCHLHSPINIDIDCRHHQGELPIEFLFPFLHSMVEVLLKNNWLEDVALCVALIF